MNILTHCETNVFFKYFLKKTIFMPPTQFEWCSVYKGCDKRTRKNIKKAIDLLNKYRFFAYCSVEPIKPYWELCDIMVTVYIPADREKWWQDCGQILYQRMFYPIMRHQSKKVLAFCLKLLYNIIK